MFRVAHQLHGAIGFCDELPLSWLSRYSEPLRRLPLGRSATLYELTCRLGRRGLRGPFMEEVEHHPSQLCRDLLGGTDCRGAWPNPRGSR